ncbi:hypothetical protein [Aureibaculum luteum]|uniref:hypothetical protein n=1 Tax=Aureibaculum luteum TaxID=1548456 RepID=UPI000E4E1A1B|nr:hypothetical protein [Aureibaculum luteum]
MTKHLQLLILLSLLIIEGVFSQKDTIKTNSNFDCKSSFLEFVKYAKGKDYENAYIPWLRTFKSCPNYSVQIYIYGLKIVESRFENNYDQDKEVESELIDSIFIQRIQYFPKNLGKIYSDWAISLRERGVSNDAVFKKLDAAFKANPTEMSIKNLTLYFKEVTERNRDTNLQLVFDTYDDVMEAVHNKMDLLSVELDALNDKESDGISLSSKEKLKLKNNKINLRGLSQIEPILDQTYGPVADCERLIQLYKKSFKKNKTDSKWLKRAVSRLFVNDCKDNELYPKMVEAWVVAENSIEAYIHYRDIIPPRRINALNKSISEIKDSYEKAEYLLKIAYHYRSKNKSTSRAYAYKALEVRPSYGDAYLLIASLYASSANSCGTDEFSKRLVYVAAADKAKKAKQVDPSVTAKADRVIKAYMKNAPGKRTNCFPSEDNKNQSIYEIKCWIGEKVTFDPYKD